MNQGPVIFKNSDDLGPGPDIFRNYRINWIKTNKNDIWESVHCSITAFEVFLYSLDFLVFHMYSNYL